MISLTVLYLKEFKEFRKIIKDEREDWEGRFNFYAKYSEMSEGKKNHELSTKAGVLKVVTFFRIGWTFADWASIYQLFYIDFSFKSTIKVSYN